MNIYQVLQIGDHHVNYCEDYALVAEIGNDHFLAAVMDGCSMGEESYFAATLVGKLLKKIAKEIGYQAFFEKRNLVTKLVLEDIFKRLFKELKLIKNQLQLETEELLTTIALLVLDKKNWNGEILVVGDGLIVCNEQLIEFEQANKPDYLGYHLGADFEEWFIQQKQRLSLANIEDISIATDGVFTFRNFNNKTYKACEVDLIELLLKEKVDAKNPRMLIKQLNRIEEKWGLRPTDDIGIIRLIK
ncbi:MAG: protein phosphatase 2C domain-containing protein [Saprospiraceae bacterium]